MDATGSDGGRRDAGDSCLSKSSAHAEGLDDPLFSDVTPSLHRRRPKTPESVYANLLTDEDHASCHIQQVVHRTLFRSSCAGLMGVHGSPRHPKL